MEQSVVPLHDRVIVKPIPNENKTSGGIMIPDTSKEKPNKGIVLSVGEGKDGNKMTVKVDDKVLYAKNAGLSIEVNEEQCLIMKESDILAII